MDLKEFQDILKIGETVAVEFKRCGNGIESDVYESVCSFLNRFGGDIFMTDGSHGCINLPPKAAQLIYENIAAYLLRALRQSAHRSAAHRRHRSGGLLVQPQHPPLHRVPLPAQLLKRIRPDHRTAGHRAGRLRPAALCAGGCGGYWRKMRQMLRNAAL